MIVSAGLRALLLLAVLALPVGARAETVRYVLTLEISWSAETHPFEWPGEEAHLSALVGTTHDGRYMLFADGRTASSGLRSVAESGRTAILAAEFAEADRKDRLGEKIEAEGLKMVPGTMTASFTATPDHPYLSFVTMIAPSPDWITGLSAIPLLQDGVWVEELRLPLWAWDAGTDSGVTYLSENAETQPAQSIRLLATPHVLTPAGLLPIGQATLRRVAE